jgi:flavodoxin I
MYEVIYFSRSGNTKKVATAIGEELGIKAENIRTVESLPESTDIFLGSGLYFMRPSKLVRDFIRNNSFQGRKVAIFGTSTSGIGIEAMWMQTLLKQKGAIITGKYYCPGRFFIRIVGKFLFIRKGRPGAKDLEKAKEFARAVKNGLEINVEAEIPEEKHGDRVLSRV